MLGGHPNLAQKCKTLSVPGLGKQILPKKLCVNRMEIINRETEAETEVDQVGPHKLKEVTVPL